MVSLRNKTINCKIMDFNEVKTWGTVIPLETAVHEHSQWLLSVKSVSGVQIINNTWVGYRHNIPPMMKMLSQNMTQRWTKSTGLGVMIGRCSPDSQHGTPDRHPANVGGSFFRYTNDDLRNHNQRRKRKSWPREVNQLALDYNFRTTCSQRGYRKRMIEIWQECTSFQTRLADQQL